MLGKHFKKYFQKYYIFSALTILLIYSCSTKKVPKGEFLLTKNTFTFKDGKLFANELPNYVSQKPVGFFPLRLWLYNIADPRYDSIMIDYMSFPSSMRTPKLRDSLVKAHKHPEYLGKSFFWSRFFHSVGKPPVLLNQSLTEKSAKNLKKFFVYKGYWDAKVTGENHLDSTAKKAQVEYIITHKDPTHIKDYYYDIPDPLIRRIYESDARGSLVKKGQILDQSFLEKEAQRITDLATRNGVFKFNANSQEIYFVTDSSQSRKQVPLTLTFRPDSIVKKRFDSATQKTIETRIAKRYKISTMDSAKIIITDSLLDNNSINSLKYNTLMGVKFSNHRPDYKDRAIWRQIIIKPGEVYDSKKIELTKRNIAAMNNFSIVKFENDLKRGSDSIVTSTIVLKPLSKYETKIGLDLHYSEILNVGMSPSAELIVRNVFGGAENLSFTLSGIVGTTNNVKTERKFFNAYEISTQVALSFPKLLLPFNYYKLIPKRYSPTSSIVVGSSIQNNIGLGRIGFNLGINYNANVNDIVTHKLTLFNTQVNFTQDKNKYYDFFTVDASYRNQIFNLYFDQNPTVGQQYSNNIISSDDVSRLILGDVNFTNNLSGNNRNVFVNFLQSLLNKDRQTQDVLINSLVYNFNYNEIGKSNYKNPFYLNFKFESAGNLLSLFNKVLPTDLNGIVDLPTAKTIVKIPYSQFVKFDLDVRKYFTFSNKSIVLRQLIGIGIPYGNSNIMPYIRSYYNGGSNDIRGWIAFGGLGPADVQIDKQIRSYMLENIKLTTNVEFRFPLNKTFEGALFTDLGNTWGLKDSGIGDQFKFNKFISQLGIASGLGIRINIAYVTLRLDMGYKIHDPNQPEGERWLKQVKLMPTLNFAFGYPF